MGGSRGSLAAVSSAAVDDDQKASWPEMVGKHFLEAAFTIKAERQDVIVELHTADDSQPPDFDAHRVCVFVDANLIVFWTPIVG